MDQRFSAVPVIKDPPPLNSWWVIWWTNSKSEKGRHQEQKLFIHSFIHCVLQWHYLMDFLQSSLC